MNVFTLKGNRINPLSAAFAALAIVALVAGPLPAPQVAHATGVGSPDTECQAQGFDFGIAKYQSGSTDADTDNASGADDYTITVEWVNVAEEDADEPVLVAEWTADPAVDGIVSKEGPDSYVNDGGTEGTVEKTDKKAISHITFCGNEEEPEHPGILRVCKQVLDEDDNLAHGNAPEATFSLHFTDRENDAYAAFDDFDETVTFTAPFTANADLDGDQENDAYCVELDNLQYGQAGYEYEQEVIGGDHADWYGEPQYQDNYSSGKEVYVWEDGAEPNKYDADGHVVLNSGNNPRTLLVVNTYDIPTGTLVVEKVVLGGPLAPSDFSFSVDNATAVSFEEDGDNELELAVGTHTVVEEAALNYSVSYENCDGVEVAEGETATCTITNTYTPPCGTELITNGGFEEPEVTRPQKWDAFISGFPGLGWYADWINSGPDERPDEGYIELQKQNTLSGWTVAPSNGQYTELDTDWPKDGTSDGFAHTQAAIELYQDVPTQTGARYTLTFLAAARPDAPAGDNKLEVLWDGDSLGTLNLTDKEFKSFTYTVTAPDEIARLSFKDAGASDNSFGPLLDEVSVKQNCEALVKVCKVDENQQPQEDWQVMLLGDKVDDFDVDSASVAGTDSTSLTGGASYVAIVDGEWFNFANNSRAVDAEYISDDSWTSHADGPAIGPDQLDLQVAQVFVPWGAYNGLHRYAYGFSPASDGAVNFRVFDGTPGTNTPNAGWYGDNDGSLEVEIYEGYTDVTGEDGCVDFGYLSHGEYELDEVDQDNWERVSGTGSVQVEGLEQTFTIVNDNLATPTLNVQKDGEFIDADTIEWTIDWDVTGEGTADNLILEDTLPVGLSFASASGSGVYDAVTRIVSWLFGNVSAVDGGTETITTDIDTELWADEVVSMNQGLTKGGDPVDAGRSDSSNMLGAADSQTSGPLNFYSLGFGGEAVLRFNNLIVNGDGNDLKVWETTWGGSYPDEVVEVLVSQDNVTFHSLGTSSFTGEFDLDGTGLDYAYFVKLIDQTDASLHGNDADGFDVDAVQALHAWDACAVENIATLFSDNAGSVDGSFELTVNDQLCDNDGGGSDTYGSLTIIKEVIGGQQSATDFSFHIVGGLLDESQQFGDDDDDDDDLGGAYEYNQIQTGTYTITEIASHGYEESYQVGNETPNSTSCVVEVTEGGSATCTIVNDFPDVLGCMDEEALNYNPEAEVNQGCEYSDDGGSGDPTPTPTPNDQGGGGGGHTGGFFTQDPTPTPEPEEQVVLGLSTEVLPATGVGTGDIMKLATFAFMIAAGIGLVAMDQRKLRPATARTR